MPQLIRLYITSVSVGFGLAAGFVALLIWGDVAGIGHLVLNSAVMGLAENHTPRGGLFQPKLIPIRVEATAKARNSRR
jgi:hypothetical protein